MRSGKIRRALLVPMALALTLGLASCDANSTGTPQGTDATSITTPAPPTPSTTGPEIAKPQAVCPWNVENGISPDTARLPLVRAVMTGNESKVEALIADGADLDQIDPRRWDTALSEAVSGQCKSLVHKLLRAGASTTVAHPQGFTPLLFAVYRGDMQIVEQLIKHGADASQVTDIYPPESPLSAAIGIPRPEMVPALIAASQDLDSGMISVDPFREKAGSFSPLERAAELGRTSLGIELLKAGATPTPYALHEAIVNENWKLAEYMASQYSFAQSEAFASLARGQNQPRLARHILRNQR